MALALRKAMERQRLVERNAILRRGLAQSGDKDDAVLIASDPMRQVKELVRLVAPSKASVLILGETGVGKEVVARMVHQFSPRCDQPFVVVDCAGLQRELLQNELFGHERGAFTGATATSRGLFEVADGGTLFLDEVGEIQPEIQVRLLRVLESGRFRRIGGVREIAVDVRIVAATNRDLPEMLKSGGFRRDLFYRLEGVRVEVPPLRERPADTECLARHFLRVAAARAGRACEFVPETLQLLLTYSWPGNIRELAHVVERAMILTRGDTIKPAQLPPEFFDPPARAGVELLPLAVVERRHIHHVLDAVEHNRHRAAELFGISERTLYRKLREYEESG